VVLVVDDLQWADRNSICFIEAILTDDDIRGLLLVGACRDAEIDAAHPLSAMLAKLERLGAAPLLLRLHNLGPAELGSLISEMLRLRPAEAVGLAEAVGARTGGNPYDTTELVNALRRDGALVLGNDGWSWDGTAIRRYVGRGDVVGLLAMRIGNLPGDARELLRIMACLGGEVEFDLMAAASGLSATELKARLAPSLEDGLLVSEHGGPGLTNDLISLVRFRHDRVQQSATVERNRRNGANCIRTREAVGGSVGYKTRLLSNTFRQS
jgi:predicted ATPase